MDTAFKIVGCIMFIILLVLICMLFANCVFCINLERVIIATVLLLVLAAAVFITLIFIDSVF